MATQNGTSETSDFGTAVSVRNRYAHEVEELESEITKLQGLFERAKYRLEAANDIVSEIEGKTKDVGTVPLKGFGKYSSMSLREATLDVLNTCGERGLLAPDIMRRLLAGGFPDQGKKFYSNVYGTAQYLVKKEKAKEAKINGKRTFMKK